ncbi:MAG: alpha/beta hydrolase [Bacteroidetes bacterium]|nr:alpha/beta hydrolase [Bacteroidota bacterium]
MKIFYISGLGADETVFQFLSIKDTMPVFIPWLKPFQNESLEDYAIRLKENYIPDKAIIIGMSFGGMLATEIAKKYPGILSILISSVKTKDEFPQIYNVGKYLPLYKYVSPGMQKWIMHHLSGFFGAHQKPAKEIYQKIIMHSDTAFNSWAFDSIIKWKNHFEPINSINIHGTADKIIPHKKVHWDYEIKGGSHLMVINQADEISALIHQIIFDHYKDA